MSFTNLISPSIQIKKGCGNDPASFSIKHPHRLF